MKAAAVALVCVMCLAVPALAAEDARPQPAAQPTATQPTATQPNMPPPALRPWVDPGSAQQVGRIPPHAPALAKTETSAPAEAAKPRQADAARDDQRRRQCLSAVETRQTVAAHRLTEPFRALRAGGQQGEALRAKLCKWKQDQFVYEVFVLRRDGRIVRLYMNAQNGQAVGALDDDRR